MKKKPMRLLTAALTLTMLSGCGAARTNTENTATETSVNQAMLLEKSGQPQSQDYTFPEKFTGDWTAQEGRLTIHADAEVVADLGTVLPTATVTPREFTQEDVDKLFSVLLKNNPLYGYLLTKQECQEHIDYTKSDQWRPGTDDPTRTPEQVEQRITFQMQIFGNHSRAIIKVNWLHSPKGHLFIAENVDDVVYFVDPQTGEDDVRWYFRQVDPARVALMRIDCVRFTELVQACCE